MDFNSILHNRFAEPAAIIEFSCGNLKTVGITPNFLPELWMNISEDTYLKDDISSCFDQSNLDTYLTALNNCAKTGEEQTCETWRSYASNCCGTDKICLSSRFILLEKNEDHAYIFEAVRNLTKERRTQSTLADIEHRYVSASEQINIYNWEYTVATKEMRPCYRCMRDLGLPAVVKNYPEPAIDAGIFPPDYADMYREMMRKIDAGAKELEAYIPLTVGRFLFRLRYTTEFDEN